MIAVVLVIPFVLHIVISFGVLNSTTASAVSILIGRSVLITGIAELSTVVIVEACCIAFFVAIFTETVIALSEVSGTVEVAIVVSCVTGVIAMAVTGVIFLLLVVVIAGDFFVLG
jgi:hypothetical protein